MPYLTEVALGNSSQYHLASACSFFTSGKVVFEARAILEVSNILDNKLSKKENWSLFSLFCPSLPFPPSYHSPLLFVLFWFHFL